MSELAYKLMLRTSQSLIIALDHSHDVMSCLGRTAVATRFSAVSANKPPVPSSSGWVGGCCPLDRLVDHERAKSWLWDGCFATQTRELMDYWVLHNIMSVYAGIYRSRCRSPLLDPLLCPRHPLESGLTVTDMVMARVWPQLHACI